MSRETEVVLIAPSSSDETYLRLKKDKRTHTIPPLGTVSVATYLNENGIPTKVIDCEKDRLSIEETVDKTLELLPDGGKVGITGWITNIDKAALISEQLQAKSPNIETFLGGPHPSSQPIRVVEKYGHTFKYFVNGEGEIPSKKIVKHWGNDALLAKEPGVILKRGEKLIFKEGSTRGYVRTPKSILEDGSLENRLDLVVPNGEFENSISGTTETWPQKADRYENVNDLPIPDYSLLGDLSNYHLSEFTPPEGEVQMSMWTARGCPFSCYFCDQEVSGHSWRQMEPSKIIEYLDILRNKYGIDYTYNTDDLYLVQLHQVEETARMIIDSPSLKGLRWEAITRSNLVNRAANFKTSLYGKNINLLELIYEAGCRQLHIAPETGNEHLREEALGKQLTNSEIIESVQSLAKVGISVKTLNMVGVPGETPKETLETLEFLYELGKLGADYAMISVCTPLPNTPLALLIEHGYIKWTGDLDDWSKMNLGDPAGIFTTDIHGKEVDATPVDLLNVAKGKHRLGKQVKSIDIARGQTIEDKIKTFKSAMETYNRSKKTY